MMAMAMIPTVPVEVGPIVPVVGVIVAVVPIVAIPPVVHPLDGDVVARCHGEAGDASATRRGRHGRPE
jgi:hypothetical protein